MTDVLSAGQRSYCMSRIRGKDTKPEHVIRRGLFAMGFRYRLHERSLPGCPDLVFPRYKAAIFVNGCFWHGHECDLFRWPNTNGQFWRKKILGNKRNDKRNLENLGSAGWRTLLVWECAIRGRQKLSQTRLLARVAKWLLSKQTHTNIAGIT
ncbi:MAG: mismatch-specific endonuclease [Candidatus Sulfotelmatobacter sp.]|nr:mismatch-specific endonuclease [Candidatus Sulfotelmatobacter sp.]